MRLVTKGTMGTMSTGQKIVIRCDLGTKHRFHTFAVPFEDHEAALNALLEEYEAEPDQKPTAATR